MSTWTSAPTGRCASTVVSIWLAGIGASVLSDSSNISTGTNASVCTHLFVSLNSNNNYDYVNNDK